MVKVANPRLPNELPREFWCQLDPKLRELYSQLPSELASRVSALVGAALPQSIHPDRVLKFAFPYATAERRAQGDAVSKEHARRSILELAGEIHGFQTGYQDDVAAKQRYHRGRRARQQIKASLDSLLAQWRVFKHVVQKNRSELPLATLRSSRCLSTSERQQIYVQSVGGLNLCFAELLSHPAFCAAARCCG